MYDLDKEPTIDAGDLTYAGYFAGIKDPVERDSALAGYINKEGLYGSPKRGGGMGTTLLCAFTRYLPASWQDACLNGAEKLATYIDNKREAKSSSEPAGSPLDDIDIPRDYIMVFQASYNIPSGAKVEKSFTKTHKIINYKGTRMGLVAAPRGQEETAILTDALCRGGARDFYYIGSAGGISDQVKPGELFYTEGEVGTQSPIPDIYQSDTQVSQELNCALLEASNQLDIALKDGRVYDASGFIREETPERVDQLLEQGFDAIEMELGAVTSVANSYGGGATGIMRVLDHLRDDEGERLNSGKMAHYVSSVRNAILGTRLAAEAIHIKEQGSEE